MLVLHFIPGPKTCPHWCLPRGWITYTDGPSGKRNAHFSCNKDMSLVGNATATCNKDGTWSSPMPSCVREYTRLSSSASCVSIITDRQGVPVTLANHNV